jgi:hypothetical protein
MSVKGKRISISFCNLNQGKPNTCGSCKHTDNDLGFVALHCDIWLKLKMPESKVRSWEKACGYYKPIKSPNKKGKSNEREFEGKSGRDNTTT